MHCASVGSTTLQPASVGVAVHWASVGSTTLQPRSAGVAMHCASVGRTAAQPASAGLAMHCARVGGGGVLRKACWVTLPAMAPVTVMASPARSRTAPVVETATPVPALVAIAPLMVSWSVALPLGPAASVIAPPPVEFTAPSIVSGLCAVRLMLPVVVETVWPRATVSAPVLSTVTAPLPPSTMFCSASAPVFVIEMPALPPAFDAASDEACVVRAMPLPAFAVTLAAFTLPPMAPVAVSETFAPAAWIPEDPATVPARMSVALV